MLQKLHFAFLYTIPLLCIAARETTKICFMVKLRNLGPDAPLATAFLMLLGIYFSLNLGLKSDKGCRKKMLMVTLIGSIISMSMLSFAEHITQNTMLSFVLYFAAISIDGIFGFAGIPVGRA